MGDSFIQIRPDSSGKRIDTDQLTVNAQLVERQRMQVSGTTDTAVAVVKSSSPTSGEFGLVTRNLPSGTQDVSVTTALPSGANNIGDVDVLTLPNVNQGTGGTSAWATKPDLGGLSIQQASINISSSGDNTVISGVGGQVIKVYKMFFLANAAVNITLKDGAATNLTGVMNFTANAGFGFDGDNFPMTLSTGNAFIINLSGAQQVSGRVWFTKG